MTHYPADHTIIRYGAANANEDGHAILIDANNVSDDPKTVLLRSMGVVLANR